MYQECRSLRTGVLLGSEAAVLRGPTTLNRLISLRLLLMLVVFTRAAVFSRSSASNCLAVAAALSKAVLMKARIHWK